MASDEPWSSFLQLTLELGHSDLPSRVDAPAAWERSLPSHSANMAVAAPDRAQESVGSPSNSGERGLSEAAWRRLCSASRMSPSFV
jgi:hypothetical protein